MNIWVINGPNLGRLDLRDSATYGEISYPDLVTFCENAGKELGHSVSVFQSDDETEIIHLLHKAADEKIPVIINPALLLRDKGCSCDVESTCN